MTSTGRLRQIARLLSPIRRASERTRTILRRDSALPGVWDPNRKQWFVPLQASSTIRYKPTSTGLRYYRPGCPPFSESPRCLTTLRAGVPERRPNLPTGVNLPVQDLMTVSPDFATLYSFNANVSISRELAKGFVVSGSYLYTKGTHLPVYRNINLVPSGAFLADGRPIFSTSARVYRGFNNILSAESVGNSNYNALNMTLQKRCGRACQLFATYTWSHAIDDAPEQNNIDSSNFLSDPTNRRRDRANSLTDKRHVFNYDRRVPAGISPRARFREPDPQRQPAFVDNAGIQRRPVQHRQQSATEPGLLGTGGLSAPAFVGRNTSVPQRCSN